MVLSDGIEPSFHLYQRCGLPLTDESLELAIVPRIELGRLPGQGSGLPLTYTTMVSMVRLELTDPRF